MKNNGGQGGQMRFDDSELSLIKSSFAENDELLKLVRKAFLQENLTEEDEKKLSVLQSPEVGKVLRKAFLPEIDVNAPLGQNIDLYMAINVQGKDPIAVSYELEGRSKLIKYIEYGLGRLLNPYLTGTGGFVKFLPSLYRTNAEEDMINVTARNTFIVHVEQQLLQLKALAGMKKETVEETKTRLGKDSVR